MLDKLKIKNHKYLFIFLFIILVKFLFVRTLLFEGVQLSHSIFIEIGYLFIILAMIELLPFKKTLYIIVNILFSLILFIVLVYHNYFGSIVTIHAFSLMGQLGGVKDSVLQLINPIYLLLFIDFIFLLLIRMFKTKQPIKKQQKNIKLITSILIIGLLLTSYQLIKFKDDQIASTVLAAEKQGIITYEILSAANNFFSDNENTLTKEELEELPEMIQELKEITPLPKDDLKYNGIAKDKNIIVIQAEAFQDFAINLEIDGQEITPYLNELLAESIYFPNTIQQNGPGNTSDAEFMFNTSLYPAAWEPTSELYGDRMIPSFPKMLNNEGYKTVTFHPNDIEFWNRNNLYPALGFDQYYDDTFFKNEDFVGMGSSDELVYEKAFPELKKMHDDGQNFYAQIVTLTSHHPFKIPEEKNKINLPDDFNDTIVNDYLESLAYTDWAVGQFIEQLKEADMWEDTIFVFYGDHMGLQLSALEDRELNLLKDLLGHEYTFRDQFNIPFIIGLPGEQIDETYENIGGHLDYMPTVANLIDLSLEDHIHFGQDIINYPENLLGMRYYMPYGSFFTNDIAFKPEEGFDDGEAFDIETFNKIEDFSSYKSYYDRIISLLDLSDRYMNSLPLR